MPRGGAYGALAYDLTPDKSVVRLEARRRR
jgi:hypothetical protein